MLCQNFLQIGVPTALLLLSYGAACRSSVHNRAKPAGQINAAYCSGARKALAALLRSLYIYYGCCTAMESTSTENPLSDVGPDLQPSGRAAPPPQIEDVGPDLQPSGRLSWRWEREQFDAYLKARGIVGFGDTAGTRLQRTQVRQMEKSLTAARGQLCCHGGLADRGGRGVWLPDGDGALAEHGVHLSPRRGISRGVVLGGL